jgi:hypothetical protein
MVFTTSLFNISKFYVIFIPLLLQLQYLLGNFPYKSCIYFSHILSAHWWSVTMLPWLSSIPNILMVLVVVPPNCFAFWYMRSYLPFFWRLLFQYLFHINFFGSVSFSFQLIIEASIFFDICSFWSSSFLHFIDHWAL